MPDLIESYTSTRGFNVSIFSCSEQQNKFTITRRYEISYLDSKVLNFVTDRDGATVVKSMTVAYDDLPLYVNIKKGFCPEILIWRLEIGV